MTDHYSTLGVNSSASPDEIKKAYRKLASQHHPDKGGDTKRFQEIQTAYDTLSDPQKKQMYDLEQQGGGPGGFRFTVNGQPFGGVPPGMEDFFNQFNFNVRRQKNNRDIRIQLPIPLTETLQEHKKNISISTSTGRESVSIDIPRGTHNGMVMRYTGLGDNMFNDVPRGDLYVEFAVFADRPFIINDLDLVTNYQIDSFDAMLGLDITVEGLDGKQFTLAVPAGVQSGTKMRIRDQGLYQIHSSHRGNLMVAIQIKTPTNLSENQIQLIKQAKNTQ
jgi:DnaJ-class molecular chaperone